MTVLEAVAFLWAATGTGGAFADKPDLTFECRPIPEAARAVTALNTFWNRSVRLCQSHDPYESAVALPDEGMVQANRQWLASVARDYGTSAATGILAHEWAHMVQGGGIGRTAELEADCLAGGFLRHRGYDKVELERFALLSFHSGDIYRGPDAHGTGQERLAAVLRGYYGSSDSNPGRLVAYCRR